MPNPAVTEPPGLEMFSILSFHSNRVYLKLELYNFTYLCTCELVFCCFLTEEIATGRQPD
jgi:hypothetical protein